MTDAPPEPRKISPIPTLGLQQPHCSFCGKRQDRVRKLVVGSMAYICDECVAACNKIMLRDVEGYSG